MVSLRKTNVIPSCFYVLLFHRQARDAAVVQGVWHLDCAYVYTYTEVVGIAVYGEEKMRRKFYVTHFRKLDVSNIMQVIALRYVAILVYAGLFSLCPLWPFLKGTFPPATMHRFLRLWP